MTIMTPSQVNFFPPEGCYEFTEYFTPEFDAAATQSCSFIRHGKIDIGGVDFKKALMQRYKPENMMSEEEKEIERKKLEAE